MLHLNDISCDETVLGGTPVFSGTRVPVQALGDYLAAGEDLKSFLQDFPSVSHHHAVNVLQALFASAVDAPTH